MSEAEVTRDRERIRSWAESRGGRPSVVSATAGDDGRPGAILRFDFGKKEASLDEVSWDEFFQVFEDNNLALLFQETTKSGGQSRFFKFVAADEGSGGGGAKGGRRGAKGKAAEAAPAPNGGRSEPAAGGRRTGGKAPARAAKGQAAETAERSATVRAAAGSEPKARGGKRTQKAEEPAAAAEEPAKPARGRKASGGATAASGSRKDERAAPAAKAGAGRTDERKGGRSGSPPRTEDAQGEGKVSDADAGLEEAAPGQATTTKDHEVIRRWTESRGGRPCVVEGTESGGGAVLRLDFGTPDPKLKEVSWDEFFEILDQSNVTFLHQDQTKAGDVSRFNKFVGEKAEDSGGGSGGGAKGGSGRGASGKAAAAKPAETKGGAAKGAAKPAEAKPAKGARGAAAETPAPKGRGRGAAKGEAPASGGAKPKGTGRGKTAS